MTAQWLPRYLLIYSSTEQARAKVPELFPAHQAHADRFRRRCPRSGVKEASRRLPVLRW